MVNNKKIEEFAINVLERALLKSPYLECYIDSNDKTPSWDGNVIVYNSKDNKKNNIMGKVPIQVKGTKNSPVNKDGTISYYADVSDLNNYYNDGGVIFFVIFVDTILTKGKIYYSSLLPYDLNSIMKKAKEQKKYAIQLKCFPDSIDEITNVFMGFLSNRQKQMGIIRKDLPSLKKLEDSGAMIESLSLYTTGIGINRNTIESYILTHDIYLYAKIKGSDIDIPVEKVSEATIARQIEASVEVKGKVFYNTYQQVYKKDMLYIQIGKSLSFKVSEEMTEGAINIKINGNLSERIRDLEFIVSLAEERHITLNGITMELNPINKKQIDEFKELLRYWNDVKKMLEALGTKEELDCDNLTNKDYNNLHNYVNAVLYDKEIGFPNLTGEYHYGLFAISNLAILLWCEKQNSGNYKVQNFFNPLNIVVFEDDNSEPVNISQFALLQQLDFSHVSNLDINRIVDDLKAKPMTNISSEIINSLALDIISGYDKQEEKDDSLLMLAESIFDILENNPVGVDEDIISLNKLQIIKRRRKITVDEIVQLARLKEESKPLAIRCASYILLEEFEKAEDCLRMMKTDDRKVFIKYPIYSLYERKGGVNLWRK